VGGRLSAELYQFNALTDDEGMALHSDGVEWLDDDPPPNPPVRPGRQRRARYVLLGAAVVVVGLVFALTRSSGKHSAAPSPTPTPTPSISTSSTSTSRPVTESSVQSTPSVSVTSLGQPLLNVPASWRLFARGSDAIYSIQPATGRITRTTAPITSSGPPTLLVVGPHEVLVHGWDSGGGWLVRDGRPARKLPGLLANAGPAFRGPEPDQVWVQTGDGQHQRMTLVDLDGRSTGVSLPIQYAGPDGAGYLLATMVGGTYEARSGQLHRITTGSVLAIGPTGWLAEECDDRHRCTLDVIDRHSGERRVLGPTRDDRFGNGVLSPDGTLAAMAGPTDESGVTAALHLIDLSSGADHKMTITLDTNAAAGYGWVWSPDSQWLFVADAAGQIRAVSRNGQAHTLDTHLPPIEQLAMH
jgi:hypothetical protein